MESSSETEHTFTAFKCSTCAHWLQLWLPRFPLARERLSLSWDFLIVAESWWLLIAWLDFDGQHSLTFFTGFPKSSSILWCGPWDYESPICGQWLSTPEIAVPEPVQNSRTFPGTVNHQSININRNKICLALKTAHKEEELRSESHLPITLHNSRHPSMCLIVQKAVSQLWVSFLITKNCKKLKEILQLIQKTSPNTSRSRQSPVGHFKMKQKAECSFGCTIKKEEEDKEKISDWLGPYSLGWEGPVCLAFGGIAWLKIRCSWSSWEFKGIQKLSHFGFADVVPLARAVPSWA